ncbi:MAG: hypothetical protein U0575_14820 [Phycisphaerales bacterium]
MLAQAEVVVGAGVGENTVSPSTACSTLVSAIGCLVGGEIRGRFQSSLRLRRRRPAHGRRRRDWLATTLFVPSIYVIATLAYAFTTGLAYAAFTGFVLDAIGKGAAATKYNACVALQHADDLHGTRARRRLHAPAAAGMLLSEAAAGVLGIPRPRRGRGGAC